MAKNKTTPAIAAEVDREKKLNLSNGEFAILVSWLDSFNNKQQAANWLMICDSCAIVQFLHSYTN